MTSMGRRMLAFCLCLPAACAAAAAGRDFVYAVSKARVGSDKKTAGISIETLTVRRAAGLEASAIRAMNAALAAQSATFHADGLACHDADYDGPWSYEAEFDGYSRSQDFLTVMFETFSACGVSPYLARTGLTFALDSGRLVPTRGLVERLAPRLLADEATIDHDVLRLGEEAGTQFMDDQADQFMPDLTPTCAWYIKQTGFKAWSIKDRLVLHPEFQQPYSVCYKDYVVRSEPATGAVTRLFPGYAQAPR